MAELLSYLCELWKQGVLLEPEAMCTEGRGFTPALPSHRRQGYGLPHLGSSPAFMCPSPLVLFPSLSLLKRKF